MSIQEALGSDTFTTNTLNSFTKVGAVIVVYARGSTSRRIGGGNIARGQLGVATVAIMETLRVYTTSNKRISSILNTPGFCSEMSTAIIVNTASAAARRVRSGGIAEREDWVVTVYIRPTARFNTLSLLGVTNFLYTPLMSVAQSSRFGKSSTVVI
jgi:hypothetical protein